MLLLGRAQNAMVMLLLWAALWMVSAANRRRRARR